MDNFKLTEKEEVLSYLEEQRCSLKRQQNFARLKAAGCLVMDTFYLMYFKDVNFISTFKTEPAVTSLCVFGALTLIGIAAQGLAVNERSRAEVERISSWISEGTFQENTLNTLEQEVVAARNSSLTKVKK